MMPEEEIIVELKKFNEIGDFTCNKIMLEVLLLLKDNKPISEVEKTLKLETNVLGSILKKFEKQGVFKISGSEKNGTRKSDSILWRGSVTSENDDNSEKPKINVEKEFINFTISRLSEALGPVAEVVVDDEVFDMGEKKDTFPLNRAAELVNILARQIPREDKKIVFQKAMMEKIKKLS